MKFGVHVGDCTYRLMKVSAKSELVHIEEIGPIYRTRLSDLMFSYVSK
jgi:hypothetical protein